MNLLGTLTFGAGAILIYGAIKDKTPPQIVRELMGNKPSAPTSVAPGNRTQNLIPPLQKLATN